MFSYNQIIERLPISLRDYIRDNVEWVMILNNAVRRAVMQSRRFNTLSTSAPLPLNISTMPIIRSIEGETTFNKTYVYSFNEIVEWTNDIRNINNDYVADVNLIVIASSLAFDDITDFNNMKDKDLTAVYSTTTSNEFIVLKYERTYYPQSPRENPNPYHIYRKYYPYTRPQPKLHPLVGMRVFASKSTNNVINYYFTPQHTIDGIWNLDFIPPSSQFTVYYDSNNNLNVVLLNADRGTDYTNAFTAFIILQANNNVFGSLGVPVQRVETDKSLNEYYDFTEAQNITMSLYLPMGQPLVINITVRFFYLNMSIEYSPNLFEECLIDPILFNLVYYETKKSLYDFVEDTAAAQYQQKIIQEEIDREVKNVKITANTVQPAQIHNNDDIIDPKDRRSTNETIKDLKKQQAANILITNAIDILKKSGHGALAYESLGKNIIGAIGSGLKTGISSLAHQAGESIGFNKATGLGVDKPGFITKLSLADKKDKRLRNDILFEAVGINPYMGETDFEREKRIIDHAKKFLLNPNQLAHQDIQNRGVELSKAAARQQYLKNEYDDDKIDREITTPYLKNLDDAPFVGHVIDDKVYDLLHPTDKFIDDQIGIRNDMDRYVP